MILSPEAKNTHCAALREFLECMENAKTESSKLQHFHCMILYVQEYKLLQYEQFSKKFKDALDKKLLEIYRVTEAKWIPEIYKDLFDQPIQKLE